MARIYLIGSLRNPSIPEIGNEFRKKGFEVFDDWYAGGPIADDSWRDYERSIGHDYRTALRGWAAHHVFDFDYHHLNRADIGVLVLPAGKSAHLELGWIIGKGKPGYVLFTEPPKDDRWDVMYLFANDVFFSVEEAVDTLAKKHS